MYLINLHLEADFSKEQNMWTSAEHQCSIPYTDIALRHYSLKALIYLQIYTVSSLATNRLAFSDTFFDVHNLNYVTTTKIILDLHNCCYAVRYLSSLDYLTTSLGYLQTTAVTGLPMPLLTIGF